MKKYFLIAALIAAIFTGTVAVSVAQSGANREVVNPLEFYNKRNLREKNTHAYNVQTMLYAGCLQGLFIALKDPEKIKEDKLGSCFSFAESSVKD